MITETMFRGTLKSDGKRALLLDSKGRQNLDLKSFSWIDFDEWNNKKVKITIVED